MRSTTASPRLQWDHDLQVTMEAGGWQTVTLTLTGTGQFVEEFIAVFGSIGA